MQGVRIPVLGPVCYGPTGPQQQYVFAVPTGGTHINLDEPRFNGIQQASINGTPFNLAAENTNIAYCWAMVGSGMSVDPSATVYGPTFVNQSAALFANTYARLPELLPQGAKGLVVRSYGAVGTGMLRIWETG